MTKEELKQRYNVKELLKKSNDKLNQWTISEHSSTCEIKYANLANNDVYIKGITYNTYLKIKEDIVLYKTKQTPYAKNEFEQDFYVKYGITITTIIGVGSNKHTEDIINNAIAKKLNITLDTLINNTVIKYLDLLHKLYYKDYILITKQLKNYKPLTYC